MHARDLIELASFVAAEGSTLLGSVRRISPDAMAQYWMGSKCRLDRWGRALREFRRQQVIGAGHAETAWSGMRGVCEEVLASEMLVRSLVLRHAFVGSETRRQRGAAFDS